MTHSVVCIGNFDGLHLGHQKVIQTALDKGLEHSLPTTLLTFRPHPQEALRPDQKIELLLTYDEKVGLIEGLSPAQIVELPFDEALSQMPAEDFFSQILVTRLGARQIVVGYDFAFGRKRSGTTDLLARLCEASGIGLTIVPAFAFQGSSELKISSSAIRKLISEARIEEANQFLGRPFFFRGSVIQGDQRGRTIGFATANLLPQPKKLIPPLGVYFTKGSFAGETHPSITNVGVRPTFHSGEKPQVVIETHLLTPPSGEGLDLYHSSLQVDFLKFLRPETKFSSLDHLKSQIQQDIESARRFFQLR